MDFHERQLMKREIGFNVRISEAQGEICRTPSEEDREQLNMESGSSPGLLKLNWAMDWGIYSSVRDNFTVACDGWAGEGLVHLSTPRCKIGERREKIAVSSMH